MKSSPRFSATRTPSAAPSAFPKAIGSEIFQSTVPRHAKRTTLARFDAKFATFALPDAAVIGSPRNVTYAIISSVPVPGPKNPS